MFLCDNKFPTQQKTFLISLSQSITHTYEHVHACLRAYMHACMRVSLTLLFLHLHDLFLPLIEGWDVFLAGHRGVGLWGEAGFPRLKATTSSR